MLLSFNEFAETVTDKESKFNQLEPLLVKLKQAFGLTPVFGVEIEFYVDKEFELFELQRIIPYQLSAEKGDKQFEIHLKPTSDICDFLEEIELARNILNQIAFTNGFTIDFTPKPFANDYGSAMHFHLNFLEDQDIEKYANILCNYAKQTIGFFLTKPSDYARLDSKFLAPTHICWGGNNRSCLIRIPDSHPKRLEHRLAGSDIDPIYPVHAILSSILEGLESANIKHFSKIYGNAFDPQYNLVPLK